MEPFYRIRSLSTRAGDVVTLPTTGVTCIVGRNNAGKSRTLNDITNAIFQKGSTGVVIDTMQVDKSEDLSIDDAREWLAARFPRAIESEHPGQPLRYTPTTGGSGLTPEAFIAAWTSDPIHLGVAGNFITSHSVAGGLVHLAVGQARPDPSTTAHSTLARLYADNRLEKKLSDLAYDTFQLRLIMDRVTLYGGLLRVGEIDVPRPHYNDSTVEYHEALKSMPALIQEGEGAKSFIGLALEVLAGQYQVLIIDEPEAFLHPGQARALGRWLGKTATETDKQIILATHDRDIVVGLLDSGQEAKVGMIRVEREGSNGRLFDLGEADVLKVWSDPVLRYSNVLQGLFHANVVICEGDADCRFYGAVFDQLTTDADARAISDDTLFVPSGGKRRAPLLAESLTALNVSSTVIVDFDALFESRLMKRLVRAVNGTWTASISTDHQLFLDHFNTLDSSKKEALKKLGIDMLSGSPHVACRRLIDALAVQGVLIVDYGEMEDLDRSIIAPKGSPWVTAMLDEGRHITSAKARALLSRLPFAPQPVTTSPLGSQSHLE